MSGGSAEVSDGRGLLGTAGVGLGADQPSCSSSPSSPLLSSLWRLLPQPSRGTSALQELAEAHPGSAPPLTQGPCQALDRVAPAHQLHIPLSVLAPAPRGSPEEAQPLASSLPLGCPTKKPRDSRG